jgi:hypothetical protein
LAKGTKRCRGREGLEGRKVAEFCWGSVGLGGRCAFGLFVLPGDRGCERVYSWQLRFDRQRPMLGRVLMQAREISKHEGNPNGGN